MKTITNTEDRIVRCKVDREWGPLKDNTAKTRWVTIEVITLRTDLRKSKIKRIKLEETAEFKAIYEALRNHEL